MSIEITKMLEIKLTDDDNNVVSASLTIEEAVELHSKLSEHLAIQANMSHVTNISYIIKEGQKTKLGSGRLVGDF